ncbi:permease prefix domain 1-containing protein [Actinophytocola sp.]|uniref:permease prefix domain 1-containing protein n=1 Tax=Actinophytocola sp. TaxID=1872138 RepID=UPI003D6A5771
MAGHALIDAHLAELARQLPAPVVDELADGLTETYEQHLASGLQPTAAATAAITEFGRPDQITAAFIRQAPGRRTAVALLATGPFLAACWGPSLIMSHVWAWPIPGPAALAFGAALLAVVATLVTAATSHHYARTRLAGVGAIVLLVLDVAMLAAVLLAAPAWVWPMTIAIPASLVRIGLTARALPHLRVG